MRDGRRFGAEGMRRGSRVSQTAAAAAPAAVTLDDIYARHAWAWWWDGDHGFDAGADTWNDRVSGAQMTAQGGAPTITASTLAGQTAVLVQPAAGEYLGTGVLPALAMQPLRVFSVTSCAAHDAAVGPVYLWGVEAGPLGESISAVPAQALEGTGVYGQLFVGAGGGMNLSSREGARFDDGAVRVIRAQCNQLHADTLFRVNGVAYTAAQASTDPGVLVDTAASVYVAYAGNTSIPDIKIVALFAIPYATIEDTQAAQVEADLLTIMGL